MAKYLDKDGLEIVWEAVKSHDIATLNSAKGYADGLNTSMDSRVDTLEGYFTNGSANDALKATRDGDNAVISSTYVKQLQLGVATPDGATPAYIGVATLGTDGKVPSSQLPSFVDDVIEGYYYQNKFYSDSAHTTEITGESGKIYVDLSTMTTYRWSGTAYVMISESLAIGITTGTAYDGGLGYALSQEVATINATVANIPTTYVPIETNVSGKSAYKSTITNTNGTLTLKANVSTSSYADIVLGRTAGTYPDPEIIMFVGDSNDTTELKIEKEVITFQTASLKLKTTAGATAKTLATTDDITMTDLKVGTTTSGASSVLTSKVGYLLTKTAYNASTNKLATESDIPSVEAISSAELATILV